MSEEEVDNVAPETKSTPKRDTWIITDEKKKTPTEHSSTARYSREKHSNPGNVFSKLTDNRETNPTPRKPGSRGRHRQTHQQTTNRDWVEKQRNLYTKWINAQFLPDKEHQVEDIEKDLRDGIVLIHLLERLTGKTIKTKYHPEPAHRLQMLDNMQVVLNTLKDEGIQLVSTSPADIVDGVEKLTLAVVNELIQHYQINFGSSMKDTAVNRRSSLLSWFTTILHNSKISDLTTSWKDGRILTTLVNYYKPNILPDDADLNSEDDLVNVTNAMAIAERELKVHQVIQPEDIVTENGGDEFMMMTYLSSFCSPGSVGQHHLLKWVNSFLPKSKIHNLSSDWSSGTTLCKLVRALLDNPAPIDDLLQEEHSSMELLQKAMEIAEKELGVTPKYSAEEIWTTKQNDQIKLMVYLAQLQLLGKDPLVVPQAMFAEGVGVEGAKVNSDVTFSIHGKGSSTEDLTIVITGPEGDIVDFDAVPSPSEGSPHYHYKPSVPGLYNIDINFFGEPIQGSPFHVMHTEPTQADNCFIAFGDVERGKLYSPVDFTVDCSEAGMGNLVVVVEDPENVQVEKVSVISKLDGQFQVKFTPNMAGIHCIYVNWNGYPIPNTPFMCRISDPDSCIAKGSGLSNTILGHVATFEVDTILAGTGSLTAAISGPGLSQVDVNLTSQDGGIYSYQYTPTEVGAYHIDIKWNGFDVRGSPFTMHATEATIASSCFIKEMTVDRSQVNQPIKVTINATKSEKAELEAKVQGPAQLECEVREIEEGIYDITFVPEEVGEYSLEIFYGETAIPDSPLHFTVNNPSKCEVDMSSLKRLTISKMVTFKVSTFDAGEGELVAIAKTNQEEFLCNISQQDNGDCIVSFMPREIGEHTIKLRFDGKSIPSSPFVVNVSEDNLSDIVVSKPALPGSHLFLVNQETEIGIHAPNRNSELFKVSGIGIETGATPALLILEPVGENDFKIKFMAALADDYKIHIKYDDQDLPQSPLIIPVNQPPNADKVFSFDPVIPLTVGEPIELILDTSLAGYGQMDNLKADITTEFNQQVMYRTEVAGQDLYRLSFFPHGDDIFTINISWFGLPISDSPCVIDFKEQVKKPSVVVEFHSEVSPRSSLSAFAVSSRDTSSKTYVKVQQVKRSEYQFSFTPDTKDIYKLHVKSFGNDIRGSPFTIDLLTPRTLPEVQHMESATLNLKTGGSGILSAHLVGQKSGPVPIKIQVTEDDKVQFLFDSKMKDEYALHVYWNNCLIKGAPFKLDVSR